MELHELLSLADEALASQSDDEAFIDNIEKYGNAFDNWFQKNESNIAAEEDQNKREKLQELAKKHEALLALAAEAHARIPSDIRNLKHKFKGLKAYIDYFPRSISVSKPTKG